MTTELFFQFWVERLGWTLLHFLWQGTVIAVVYAVLRSLLGRSPSRPSYAQRRYVLACSALVTLAAAPPLTFLLIPSLHAAGSWIITTAEWQRLLAAVVILWLLGVVAFSIRLLGGWRYTARLRASAHPGPDQWRRTLQRIAVRMGATECVGLLVSALVEVPTVIGWFRPVILVPVEFFTGLSFDHISALLAHELAHIRRRDYLVSLLQGIVESVLFYHPAVWWISEQIRAERELCCDDLAIAATGDILAYARALTELESRQPAQLTSALAANGGSLVNRIRRLIEPAQATRNSAPGPAAGWAMALLWLAGAVVAAVHGPERPAAVVSRAPVITPAPGTLETLAGKLRGTVLYDPLLSGRPARPLSELQPADGAKEAQIDPFVAQPPRIIGNGSLPPAPAIELPGPPTAPPQVSEPDPIEGLAGIAEPAAADIAKVLARSGGVPGPAPAIEKQLSDTLRATPAQRRPPVFRTSAKLVQVDVIARRKGAPAAGLTKDDFILLDNGKPQEIASFSVTSSHTAEPAVRLGAGAVSNQLGRDGESIANATVLLIDQRNATQADQTFAIQRIVKFFRTRSAGHGRLDRMGIYTFGRDGLRALQEITGDAEALDQAVDLLKSQDPGPDYDDPRALARAAPDRALLNADYVLQAIARHLASVPGRKGLIWVSAGLSGDISASELSPATEETARALNDAGVALYAVDARGLVGALSGMTGIANAEAGLQPFDLLAADAGAAGARSPLQFARPLLSPAGSDGMSLLARLTGGLALNNNNGIEDSIQRALDDAELTYTLRFYPGQEDRDGVWHKLNIKVTRPGVRLRYRGKYFAPGTLSAANDGPRLPELLRAPLDATQLRLVAQTSPDRVKPNYCHVRLSVDLHDVHLENQNDIWQGSVDVSFFVEGSGTAQKIARRLEIPDGQLAAALKSGLEVEDSIGVDGHTGQLRIVAQDRATGAAGSVRVPLDNK